MSDIVEEIVKNLWNGKAAVIQFNHDANADDFLFKRLKKEIESSQNKPAVFSVLKDSFVPKDVVRDIANIIEFSKGNKIVFLIHDLFHFASPEAIINLFYGKEDVAAVITADMDVAFSLKGKDTQVRGRYDKYFLAPELYGDDIQACDYHLGALHGFSSKEEAARLYKFLVNHSGEVLSFRQIYENSNTCKSLPFCISAINYMNKAGMLYILERVVIKDGKKLSSGKVFYPTFISDLDLADLPESKRYKIKKEAYLVAKLFSENYKVSRAISYYSVNVGGQYNTRTEFNRGFLVESFDRKCVIKIDFKDEDETMMARFKKAINNIPHIIAVLGRMGLRFDDNGIAYCGLENLLLKGLDAYGGF